MNESIVIILITAVLSLVAWIALIFIGRKTKKDKWILDMVNYYMELVDAMRESKDEELRTRASNFFKEWPLNRFLDRGFTVKEMENLFREKVLS